MTDDVILPLHSGGSLRMQGDLYGTAADFRELSRLLSGTLAAPEMLPHSCTGGDIPAEAVMFGDSRWVTMFCDLQNFVCYQAIKTPEQLSEPVLGVFVWYGAVLAAAVSALLRGENVLLMHCAMLERDSEALLLCGESGVGKSTTSCRWREAGYAAVADDMVLLEFSGNGIFAHRLPTWSACRTSGTADKSYPFNPPLRVKNILALGRSENSEKIGTISATEYLGQLYHCACFHYAPLVTGLPEDLQYRAAGKMRELFGKMTELFPPQALFAALDGNITESLRGIL